MKNEGVLALYKGVGPRLSRVCAEVAITMSLYGEVVKVLNKCARRRRHARARARQQRHAARARARARARVNFYAKHARVLYYDDAR